MPSFAVEMKLIAPPTTRLGAQLTPNLADRMILSHDLRSETGCIMAIQGREYLG